MLWFERQVVRTLMSPTLDADARSAIESYVAATLHSMPERRADASPIAFARAFDDLCAAGVHFETVTGPSNIVM